MARRQNPSKTGRRRKSSARGRAAPRVARRPARRRGPELPAAELTEAVLEERLEHPETSPLLSGGDVDADWQRAESTGEEAVGGSVATPDQDVVDDLGRALGVEQPPEAEVRTSEEILRTRDRLYWHLERKAAEEESEEAAEA